MFTSLGVDYNMVILTESEKISALRLGFLSAAAQPRRIDGGRVRRAEEAREKRRTEEEEEEEEEERVGGGKSWRRRRTEDEDGGLMPRRRMTMHSAEAAVSRVAHAYVVYVHELEMKRMVMRGTAQLLHIYYMAPISTTYQHNLSAQPISTTYQHNLSAQPISTTYQPIYCTMSACVEKY